MDDGLKGADIVMDKKELELENDFIVLAIPVNTVDLEIRAKVMIDGELVPVMRTMRLDEIREAFKEAEHGYIPSDAVFSLTPLGELELERLKEKYKEEDYDYGLENFLLGFGGKE